MKRSMANIIGGTLAHIQDLFDTVVHTGIKKIQSTQETNDQPIPGKRKKASKLIKFISDIGDSYYRSYTEIKSKTKMNHK